MNFAAPLAFAIDAGAPIAIVAGVHPGCFELFGGERIRTVCDLKGKTVATPGINSPQYLFLASISASVGLDAQRDIQWVTHPPADAMRLFAEGKIDALLAFPPDAQELRAKKFGHVVLDSAKDRPWSQYYCCLAVANREFLQKNPIATKRALRAIIKDSDICAADPDRGAKPTSTSAFRLSRSTPSRRCAKSLTVAGATTTRKTRCASMRCACGKRGWSRVRRRS